MSNSFYPCLWFEGNAFEAATLYCSLFPNSKIVSDNPMVVKFEIAGKSVMGLNGGPTFKINPSISFFVTCETEAEVESIWNALINDGTAFMALGKYPWSEKYGWLADKYGMTWQIMLGKVENEASKISNSMLFVGDTYGKAVEAIHKYNSIFSNSKILDLQLYQANEPQPEGKLKFGQFMIQNELFVAMDGSGEHNFQFSEAFSFVIECENQKEIDYYWEKLGENGKEMQCGWIKDQFGVCWQVIPTILSKLMNNPETAYKTATAFMKMNKFDIAELEKAAYSEE